ncbi:MAG: flavodoxin-dependent (E)-4-hydroxy-3-methylbut-2-enyl-diphosphate synthase [Candidatus Omnitrophica bacterium]|nr:flavodoxin-dependent (E)-4-hydroxy-3-methylbut-2-enyl-diphosphate synthase [Candidatus Omnitrophota bacterium]
MSKKRKVFREDREKSGFSLFSPSGQGFHPDSGKAIRRKEIKIGGLGVGGENPVRIAGMLKSPCTKESMLLREAKKMAEEGAELVRIAFKEERDKKIFKLLKKEVSVPLVADIHFNWKLALSAIETGFENIRLNPLNISRKSELKEIIKEAKKALVSIRIGINSGGFRRKFKSPLSLAEEMVKVVGAYIKFFEDEGFFDIIVSLKASEVRTTLLANRIFAGKFSYPLHLGVTATGPYQQGIIKSALGIGILLSEGIGDLIRVSLTGPSRDEIKVAKAILQFLDLRSFFPEIVSCPTCGRCEVDLVKLVSEFEKKISGLEKDKMPKKIALMGCIVNGPGEAYQADIGVAFGKKKAVIFKKDKILGYTKEDSLVKDLLGKIRG